MNLLINALIGLVVAAAPVEEVAPALSVCDLQAWGPEMAGRGVIVRGEYSSDFMHVASLGSRVCPSFHLSIGVDGEDASGSIAEFDATLDDNIEYYRGRDFHVEMEVVFIWLDEQVINADLHPSKQLIVPARGGVSIERVLSFEQPSIRESDG